MSLQSVLGHHSKEEMSFEEVVPIHRFADFSEAEEVEPYG